MKSSSNYGSTATTTMSFRSHDESVKFSTLSDKVVANIYEVNSCLKALNDAHKAIGTPQDNKQLRKTIHATQFRGNQIASKTSKDIHELKCLVPRTDKIRILQVEKLESNFEDAVKQYYELQRNLASKQKLYLLPMDIENDEQQISSSEVEYNRQKQAQLLIDVRSDNVKFKDREEQIKYIEANILDINVIMRNLGKIVHQHGEVIDTIENSIDHALGNIEEGTEQLLIGSRYQNKYRRRLAILIIICAIIAAIIIGILVSELRK